MRKIFSLIGVVLIGLSSCQNNVDRTNIYKVGEAIHESFIKKDTTILKQVFEYQMDSISKNQRDKVTKIQDLLKPDLTIIKMDTSYGWLNHNYLDLFYKEGKDFYRIRAIYIRDLIGIISVTNLNIINISEECEDYKNTPYCPSFDVKFKRISWSTDYYGTTFKSGKVFFENNSDNDYNYVKFRLTIENGISDWDSEIFFNQTVESYKPSYKGDITSYEIPGMKNYYAGFKIKKENLSANAELIEVLPKPESYWCKLLEELKDEIINKNK